MIERTAAKHGEPLAVVGVGCRLPGANHPTALWEMLIQGRSAVREVPPDRWQVDRFYHPDATAPGKMVSRWGGFVENLKEFDAAFWGISPREANRMDPQQRWMLEVAWEALEDAGVPPSRFGGRNIGVFVGISSNDYGSMQLTDYPQIDMHTNSGGVLSIAANRISYLLNLKGPSIAVDTACSSALVAATQACQSIWAGECEAALVGGCNALITPHSSIGFSKASMLSPSGKCYAFDARADGYVRAEGAAMLLIKPLSQAIANDDPVYAVIRAAVTNQDGRTSTMTVPGIDSQAALLKRAYREAGVAPSEVRYVEAHGTGTPVGDPIEAMALGKVLGLDRPPSSPCLIGSIKTNIGHMESGSGIAGLLKAVLVLQHGNVPASLNFSEPSPQIPFEQLRLKVAQKNESLAENGQPAIASVNSFGFGGANAHLVLQQPSASLRRAPSTGATKQAPDANGALHLQGNGASQNNGVSSNGARHSAGNSRPFLLPVSARSEPALRAYAAAYRDFLRDSGAPLGDVCFTSATHKEQHPHWLAVQGENHAQLREAIDQWLIGEETPCAAAGESGDKVSSLSFVYTGQGPQWWGMGQRLLRTEPVFKKAVTEVDTLLHKLAGWSLLAEMGKGEDASQINRTDIAQPAIFAMQVGLTKLWESWGVTPSQTTGHSVGEVAAAYAAGVYSLQDAVRVIYHRSRLQQQTSSGAMMAVGVAPETAREMIAGAGVEITAVNSPQLVTLGGNAESIQELAGRLREEGVFHRVLPVNFAFHTCQMDSIRQELLESLAGIEPQRGVIPFVSSVTGARLNGEKLDALYWWRNVRQPVLFAPAMSHLLGEGETAFLELGPHPSLRSSMQQCIADAGSNGQVFHSVKRTGCEQHEMLATAARLHFAGLDLDWRAITGGSRKHLSLPAYPWQRETYWVEPSGPAGRTLPEVHPLLGQRSHDAHPTWRVSFDARVQTYLEDHKMWDGVVFPAAGYAEIGSAIARELFPNEPYVVEDLKILQAIFINAGEAVAAQITYDSELKQFSILTTIDNVDWTLHARGRLVLLPIEQPPGRCDFESICGRMQQTSGHEDIYQEFAASGYQFGPKFSLLQKLYRSTGEAVADISVPPEIGAEASRYHLHPTVLDACVQAARGLQTIPASADPREHFYLPAAMQRVRLYASEIPSRLRVHAMLLRESEQTIVADLLLHDEAGNRIADIRGFETTRRELKKSHDDIENCLYQFQFVKQRLRGSGVEGACNFPQTQELIEAVRPVAKQAYAGRDLHRYYEQFMPVMQQVVLQLVQNAFLDLGWDYQPGQHFAARDVVERLRISYQHRRLTEANLNWLCEGGLLTRSADVFSVSQPMQRRSVDAKLENLRRDFTPFASEIRLVQQVAGHLADVLRGSASAVDLLFPDGANDLLEDFYTTAGDFPVYASLLQEVVHAASSKLPERRTLRVLEVGAGTGSLTRELLPHLPHDQCEYHFTDVSPAFLATAQKQFAEYPFMEFHQLDIEKQPGAQQLPTNSCDMVLATNVLHATRDLRKTLANLAGYLAEDGLLVFLEVVRPRPVWDNTFGLLNGWWRMTDRELRSQSPLLDRDSWEALLAESGFRQVQSFICSPDDAEAEQAVFIAQAPGLAGAAADGNQQTTAASDSAKAMAPLLVIQDQNGAGQHLAEELRRRGETVITAQLGNASQEPNSGAFQIDANADGYEQLFSQECFQTQPPRAIIHCRCLDHPAANSLNAAGLEDQQQTGVLDAMRLVQALQNRYEEDTPRLYFITRDSRAVVPGDKLNGLAAAPLLGLVRVLNNEHADYQATLIDLEQNPGRYEAAMLADEILAASEELEVAVRDDQRYVNRLRPIAPENIPHRTTEIDKDAIADNPYRLQTSQPGSLANLSLNETVRRAPGPHEIEVEVKAAGINFRDVMKALGIYPGDPIDRLWLGDDFAGVVLCTGEKVTTLQAGDRVAGMAPRCFASHTTVDARMTFPVPPGVSFEQAATLPTVFLTAYYAIEHLARACEGESILIHAATGGVGQAAVQIARNLGLEIFATAGTPEKRQMLRDMGITHVMNSRTVEFADQIRQATGGNGVDIVLNSLAGEFIPKSFSVLAPFGRFLEIGKVDIYQNAKFGLAALKDNISYFVIDLAQHIEKKPAFIARLFYELHERFASGDYQPLPHRTYPVAEAADAFRMMAQGKHSGKNVLSFEVDRIRIGACTQEPHLLRPGVSYLVTGGTSGFGLKLVQWMAEHGARNIVVMSRSGPHGEAATQLQQLRDRGVNILDTRGDVSSAADVENVLAQISAKMPPLKGVVHGAMVLDDDFVTALDEQRFNRVMHPKMLGAWNLHRATADLALEHFVCFSSFSNVMGAVRQANYNAGNAFLDALAEHRKAQGLCALTINWGALSGAGFVARNQKTAAYLEKIGLLPFSMSEASEFFGQSLMFDTEVVAASRVDWQTLSRLSPAVANTPLYKPVTSYGARDNSGASIRTRVLSAATHERAALLEDFLVEQVAGVFSIEASKVDRQAPLTRLGLDSLMAVDLMNRVEGQLAIKFPMGNVLSGPDVQTLSAQLLATLTKTATGEESSSDSALPSHDRQLSKIDTFGRQFPVARHQQRLLEQNPSGFNVNLHAIVTQSLNAATLERAVERVAQSQRVLRTMVVEGETPRLEVADKRRVKIQQLDPTCMDQQAAEFFQQPFQLGQGDVLHVGLAVEQSESHLLLAGAMPLLDRASLGILLEEFLHTYRALENGDSYKAGSRVDYLDYLSWRESHPPDGQSEAAGFWTKTLEEAPVSTQSGHHAEARPQLVTFAVDADLTHDLISSAACLNATPGDLIFAAFQVAMHIATRQDDLLLGVTADGRDLAALQGVAGPLDRVLPFRSQLQQSVTFAEFLQITMRSLEAAVRHGDAFDQQRIEVDGRSRFGLSGMYTATFNWCESPLACDLPVGETVGDLIVQLRTPLSNNNGAPLHLEMLLCDGEIHGGWVCDSRFYDEETTGQLTARFLQVLEQACRQPDSELQKLHAGISDVKPPPANLPRIRMRPATTVDFDAECCLEPDVQPGVTVWERTPQRLVLTGATGFLGAFLLDELLRETAYDIICPVRAGDAGDGMQRIRDNVLSLGLNAEFADHVSAIPADISLPRLGLSESAFEQLAASADMVLHNAASVNLSLPYEALRQVNVDGTREILKLACHGGAAKPLHYVSTFTVHTAAHNRGEAVSESSELPPAETLLHGYSQTKWVSEKLLGAARERGLPVTVYRPGHITGHSQTGMANTGDLLHSLVRLCVEVGSAPRRDAAFDLTPVDYVARSIVALVQQDAAANQTFLLTNPEPLDSELFADWLSENYDELDVTSYAKWRDRVVQFAATMEDGGSLRPLIDTLAPRVLDGKRENTTAVHPVFQPHNTLQALAGSGIECPAADTSLLWVYFNYFVKSGFMATTPRTKA